MTTTTVTRALPMYLNQVHGALLDLAKQKLGELIAQGYCINGFAIARDVEGSDPQRGFITVDGLVGWWTPGLQALERAHEAMEKLRGRCEQAEAAIDAARAVELERDELRAQVEGLTSRLTSEEKAHETTLEDRDRYHEMADALADAMGQHFGADIGEHSSANCPWKRALEAIHNTPSPLTRPAVPEGYDPNVRYDLLDEFAAKHKVPFNELCSLVRSATSHLRAAAPQPEVEVAGPVPDHVSEAQAAVARNLEVYHRVADRRRAEAVHPDDAAIDCFAGEALKHKMAEGRAKGRSGWETCPPEVLSRMLREHVEKGDPRDVALFCMMLWSMGARIEAAPPEAVSPRHPTVVKWRRDGIAACADIAEAYGHHDAARDMRAMLPNSPEPQPEATIKESSRVEAQPTEAAQPIDNLSEDYKQGWMDGMSEATRLSAPVVTAKDALGLLAIEDDAIVLRLTADAAASSFANDPKAQTERPAVTDKQQFLRDVFNALASEREDGSTRLTDVLDWAEREAWEQGSLGLAAQKGGT